MPIINIGESKEMEFGHGDIEVGAGLLNVDEVIGAVVFWNSEKPQPIGTFHHFGEDKEIEIEETPVRMTFAKIESIDVVIDALLDARKLMLESKI